MLYGPVVFDWSTASTLFMDRPTAGGQGPEELQLAEGDGELWGEPGEDQQPQEGGPREHQDSQVTIFTT